MVYVLWICIGVTWAGCGAVTRDAYPTQEHCSAALKEIRVLVDNPQSKAVVAACRMTTIEGARKSGVIE